MEVILKPLEAYDREQFVLDNQEAFKYGAMEEFGMRDDHFEEDVPLRESHRVKHYIARMTETM